MTPRTAWIAVGIAAACLAQGADGPRTFHVDDANGDDARAGTAPASAWRTLERANLADLRPGDRVLFRRGGTWRGQLVPRNGAADAAIVYAAYGEGAKPRLLGSVPMNRPEDWESAGPGLWRTAPVRRTLLDVDVGNIIFDDGAATGVKKWSADALAAENDYLYDAPSQSVLLRCPSNPAAVHRSIELALNRHIVDQRNRSFVTYEDLSLAYGAAHGIGGASTRGITVRRCDIVFIGGGHQFTRPGGKPVRFGNGIEFWSNARDCLVEDCRIGEADGGAGLPTLGNYGAGASSSPATHSSSSQLPGHADVEFAFQRRGAPFQDEQIVTPGNFSHQRCEFWRGRVGLVESPRAPEVRRRKSPDTRGLRPQIGGQPLEHGPGGGRFGLVARGGLG